MELNYELLQTKITKFCALENLSQDLYEKELKCIQLKKEFDNKVAKLEKYNEKLIVEKILNYDAKLHKKILASEMLTNNYIKKSKMLSSSIWHFQRRQEEIDKNQSKLIKEISHFDKLLETSTINSLKFAQMVANEINNVYQNELKADTIETKNLLSLDDTNEKNLYKVKVTILAKPEMLEKIKKFNNKISIKQLEELEGKINKQEKQNCPKLDGEFIILEKQANHKINYLRKLLKSENAQELKNIKNLKILEKIIKNHEKMQKNNEKDDNFQLNYSIL